MIVVPTLSTRQQGDPPVVAGIVACREALGTPHVSGGIDQPRRVKTDNHTEEDAPENEAPATENQQSQSNYDEGNPMIFAERRA